MPETKIAEPTDIPALNIALDTINLGKQAIIFVNTKKGAERAAEDLSDKIKKQDSKLIELSEKVRKALSSPTKQCQRLAQCVKKGIAFHHAGLVAAQRELIEDSFRGGLIKVICSTPTLALGVDLPAFRAIVRDLKRYGGPRGMSWIPVLEFQQMSGRAGRPKFDKWGEAICIAQTEAEKDQIYEKYITGEAEDIYSKLAVEPVLRTYLLSLIATNFVHTKKEILDFFEQTFWAFQFEDMDKLEGIIEKMLDLLEEFEFIRTTKKQDDFISANEIRGDDFKVTATALGKRVAELYIDPLTAHDIIIALRKATQKDVKEFSFMHLLSGTLEIRPLLRVKVKEFDKIQERLTEYDSYLIVEEPSFYDPEYEQFINSAKTALFFQDWIDEKDEEHLLETYDIRPGEIRAKLDIADWLMYATEEIARLLHFQKILKEVSKTRFRLRYGVKEELFALLKLKGIGRARARRLFNNRIKDIGDVRKADILTLVQILGKQTAINVKKQVGIDIDKEKVPERKRKGQISLKDY